MKYVALAIALVLMLGATAGASARPNVLFVCVDDMNDWVSCLGGYGLKAHTPNIDRLAGRGTLFTAAYCTSPKCGPSRAAVLTGLRPTTTGIYDNVQWLRPHRPDVKTIPQHFLAGGYYVAGAGKVCHHTAGNNPPDQWSEFFDQVYDDPWDRPDRTNYPRVVVTDPPPGFPFNGITPHQHEMDWGSPPLEESKYGDVQATDWIIRRLADQRDRPFFLAAGLFHPHLPWLCPPRYFDAVDPASVVLPPIKEDDADDLPAAARALIRPQRLELAKRFGKQAESIHAYLSAIAFADAQVGKLLDALDESGQADDTVVVFWSDHGWHHGEKGHWMKSTLWERATRVPLVIVAPGVTQPGTRCDRPVNLLDLYPTLIELCELEAKPELEGASLVPLLADPAAKWERPSVTTWRRGNHAVRDERYRYIRYHDGSEELYDHQSDPHEWTNLADRREHAALKQRLARWMPATEVDPAPGKDAYQFDLKSYTWTRKSDGKRLQ